MAPRRRRSYFGAHRCQLKTNIHTLETRGGGGGGNLSHHQQSVSLTVSERVLACLYVTITTANKKENKRETR